MEIKRPQNRQEESEVSTSYVQKKMQYITTPVSHI